MGGRLYRDGRRTPQIVESVDGKGGRQIVGDPRPATKGDRRVPDRQSDRAWRSATAPSHRSGTAPVTSAAMAMLRDGHLDRPRSGAATGCDVRSNKTNPLPRSSPKRRLMFDPSSSGSYDSCTKRRNRVSITFRAYEFRPKGHVGGVVWPIGTNTSIGFRIPIART